MIRQYLSDIINDPKTQVKWEIQFTIEINSISSKDSKDSKSFNETRTMDTASGNIEIMIGNETDEITKIFSNLSLKNIKKD